MNNILKFVLVAVAISNVIAEVTLPDDMKALKKQHEKRCFAKTEVPESLVEDARKGKFSEDDKFRKYVYCMSQHMEFQNENGELQEEVIKTKVIKVFGDENIAKKIRERCVPQDTDPVELAVETFKCLYAVYELNLF